MRDLTLWYQACMQKTGRPSVMEWDWLLNSLKGRLVRLGRLQYEPGVLEEAIRTDEYSFPKGVRKLEIHIPADGKLEPEQISSSLSQAQTFFAGNKYRLMHCHSWLLSPALHRILPPSSNILSFQSFFRVYGEDFSYRQAEERVFGERSALLAQRFPFRAVIAVAIHSDHHGDEFSFLLPRFELFRRLHRSPLFAEANIYADFSFANANSVA